MSKVVTSTCVPSLFVLFPEGDDYVVYIYIYSERKNDTFINDTFLISLFILS